MCVDGAYYHIARYAILQCNCEIQAKGLLQRCPVYDGNRVEEEKEEGAMKIILDRHRADAFE